MNAAEETGSRVAAIPATAVFMESGPARGDTSTLQQSDMLASLSAEQDLQWAN